MNPLIPRRAIRGRLRSFNGISFAGCVGDAGQCSHVSLGPDVILSVPISRRTLRVKTTHTITKPQNEAEEALTGTRSADSPRHDSQGVQVTLKDGSKIDGDILVGVDGIWSNVRAQLWDQVRSPGSWHPHRGTPLKGNPSDSSSGTAREGTHCVVEAPLFQGGWVGVWGGCRCWRGVGAASCAASDALTG